MKWYIHITEGGIALSTNKFVGKIFSHVTALVAGVIIGRMTKTASIPKLTASIESSEADMKEAAICFAKIALSALIQGIQTGEGGLTPGEFAEVRTRAVDSVLNRFGGDTRIPSWGRPILRSFMEWISDPTQLPPDISPEVLRLSGDIGDYLSKRIAADPEFLSECPEMVTILKPVLRQWETENRPEAHTRILRHFIGALSAAV